MQEHTDAELVVLARAGEAEAFVHLVERYRLIASAVALRHLADREHVRDIVQEAILQAYLSLDHLREPARFKSWFYAIVVNNCRTWLRRQHSGVVSLETLAPDEVGAWGPDPQDVVEEHERVEAVRAALSMLSPKVRQVIASFYDDQLSIQEIAVRFGITPTATRNRLYKGRNELRRCLQRAYPDVSPPAALHRRKPTMITTRLADSISQGRYTLIVLLEEARQRALPLWVRQEESSILRSQAPGRSPDSAQWSDLSPLGLVVQVLTATGASVEEVHILNLQDDILYAVVEVRNNNTVHALKTRVGHAVSLAVRLDAPIRVAEAVLDAFGIQLPVDVSEPGKLPPAFAQHLWHLLPPASLIGDVAGLPISPQNLAFHEGAHGWQQGEHFTFTLDPAQPRTDQASAALQSREGESKGWLMQGFLADAYREKHMRFAGWIKAQELRSAGLRLTIEGVQQPLYQANKMIQGTRDWTFCEIAVVVPADGLVVTLGVVAIGSGSVWMDGLQFTEVPEPSWQTHPKNLDFVEGLQHWEISDTIDKLRGSLPQDYEGGLDQRVTHHAPTSAYVLRTRSGRGGHEQDHPALVEGGALKQVILAETYRGKQVRLSGTIKTEAVVGRAGLFLRAGSREEMLCSEDLQDRSICGTQAWRQEAITLTIPQESLFLLFGIVLYGSGQIWVEDIHLEIVHDEALSGSR